MYGFDKLKNNIVVNKQEVECPVNGCNVIVKRQRIAFKKDPVYCCAKHKIYISPSTFEYCDEKDNYLWDDPEDEELLFKIKQAKRESRMARDNSEDAITWNVFRYLEKEGLLNGFLTTINGARHDAADIMYWSYNQHFQDDNHSWPCLNLARQEFGEQLNRSSEPDIIIKTDSTLFFIECKLRAGNDTTPNDVSAVKKYMTGGENWFNKVFCSEYNTIAICEKKYELMRFWLIGTWMAEQLGLQFYLVNLVPEAREKDIESRFRKHILEDKSKRFVRHSWENIHEHIRAAAPNGVEKDIILSFYMNKTLGYNGKRELMKAFMLN